MSQQSGCDTKTIETVPGSSDHAATTTGKLSLLDLAERLESVMDAIDASESVDMLLPAFIDAKAAVAVKVDNCINYLRFCESQIADLKERRDTVMAKVRGLEKHREKFKDYLCTAVRFAEGVPLRGKEGRLTLRKNSAPSIRYTIASSERTYPRQVTVEQIEEFKLHDYVDGLFVHSINHEKVKRALESGKELGWATLEHGEHLRIL